MGIFAVFCLILHFLSCRWPFSLTNRNRFLALFSACDQFSQKGQKWPFFSEMVDILPKSTICYIYIYNNSQAKTIYKTGILGHFWLILHFLSCRWPFSLTNRNRFLDLFSACDQFSQNGNLSTFLSELKVAVVGHARRPLKPKDRLSGAIAPVTFKKNEKWKMKKQKNTKNRLRFVRENGQKMTKNAKSAKMPNRPLF